MSWTNLIPKSPAICPPRDCGRSYAWVTLTSGDPRPDPQGTNNSRIAAGRDSIGAIQTIRIIKHEAVPDCGSFEADIRTGNRPGIFIGKTFRAAGLGPNK